MPSTVSAARFERRMSDPLAAALAPPAGETPDQRDLRLRQEKEAKKVSDIIDEQIRQEKEAIKVKSKSRKEVKVLLLGQSESGKSTTLKQFQLLYTPNAFRDERITWRPVIYLNFVRSVRRIIDALSPPPESDAEAATSPVTSPESEDTPESRNSTSDAFVQPDIITQAVATSPAAQQQQQQQQHLFAQPKYVAIISRLRPFLALEGKLMVQLSATDDDEATDLFPPQPSPPLLADQPTVNTTSPAAKKEGEMSVHTRHNWKKALKFSIPSKTRSSGDISAELDGGWNDPNDPCHALAAARSDVELLWNDKAVQLELQKKRLRLEESSGFYLDSIRRVTDIRYIPSDDDVLRARLKTMGVVEHTFAMDPGRSKAVDWKIYDVGGARSQRHAWIPYFTDINALIFLAPISAFDQVLAEDPRVNRLEDSLLLWRAVVSSKLLAGVNIILFLNKCDLLRSKLDSGVRLSHYMTSYGERPNDAETVAKYFKNKFLALNQTYTPNPDREVYLHMTSVIDIKHTSSIIANVRDIILRDDLRDVKLL